MKQIISMFIITLLVTVIGLSQTFKTVSIRDIQYQPDDSLAQGKDISKYVGDTVRVVGRVMVNTLNANRKPIMWAGARWQTYLADTGSSSVWCGLNVIQDDSVTQLTLMDLLDTTQIVAITGIVAEFGTTYRQTQINVLRTVPVEFLSSQTARPLPVEVQLSEFASGTAPVLTTGEKYEGAYVVFRNVKVSNLNTTSGTFAINDESGNQIQMHDQSGYFTKRSHTLATYTPPANETVLAYIRGVIGTGSAGYVIRPMYQGDIQLGAIVPPAISGIQRDQAIIGPNQSVQVTAKITDPDGTIASAKVIYQVNNGGFTELSMSKFAGDSIWAASIPGVPDSAMVNYFIKATDNGNNSVINPNDTSRSRYFYFVLNRPLTISDVQYTPYLNGLGGYVNQRVTLRGIVTADTSDLRGDGGSEPRKVYIQTSANPWCGIYLRGIQADGLYRGYDVTVSGKVYEAFSHTSIDSITNVVINNQTAQIPQPSKIKTTDFASGKGKGTPSAEKWEGCLVTLDSLTITRENADGNPGPNGTGNSNFGEMMINDGGGDARVELQDGNHKYHNTWTAVPPAFKTNAVHNGDKLTSLTGILYFSFSNYKLLPRKDNDFVGYVPVSVNEPTLPENFSLSQNYPNPFNPATIIEYVIPKSTNVSLKIYNIMGKEISTLVENERQNQGIYRYTFDAGKLASGVYIYRLVTNEFQATKKMIFVK